MPKLASLRDLYIEELRDLYSAEGQITKALPKMMKAATAPELKAAFEKHLKETEGRSSGWRRSSKPWASPPRGRPAPP